jgi:hypothetical protein
MTGDPRGRASEPKADITRWRVFQPRSYRERFPRAPHLIAKLGAIWPSDNQPRQDLAGIDVAGR